MRRTRKSITRRRFVAGAGATALAAASLASCSSPAEKPTPEPQEPNADDQNKEPVKATAAEAPKEKVAYDRDEGKWVPTTCNMCFNNCSILAHVVDGVVVELEGNPDSSIGRGHICGKGAAGIMQLYDPNRITKPLKRTNPEKGFDQDPGWEEISWDEAYELVQTHIQDAIARSGPHAVTGISMVASQIGSLVRHTALGAIYGNAEGSCSDICGAGVHQLEYLFTGTGNARPDYPNCNYVIQFGTNAGTATRHGFNMTAEVFAERRRNGLRHVVIDPHMGASGEKADLWVPIRPGTDAAAALSMAYVLVHEEDLIDRDFLTNRTNGPSLVDTATGRIVFDGETGKSLYMDADGTPKPYDVCEAPQLEGTFEVDGKQCATAFTLYKEHLLTYTPEYQEQITTIPAATIRTIAKELGEAACIGQTTTVEGKTLPLRPAAVDGFSGITRHKHAFHACWAVFSLNNLIGSTNAVGGFCGFNPACNGWADNNPNMAYRPSIWEPEGLINNNQLLLAFPNSYYQKIYEGDYTPTTMGMLELQPMSEDNHFEHIAQHDPDMYHTQPAEVALCYACNPIKWWGNYDEQAEIFKNMEYVIGIDMFLNESSYFYDVVLPECTYLERSEPLPHAALNHRVIGTMDNPWTVSVFQKVVEPRDNAPSSWQLFAEMADRAGKNAEFNSVLNMMFRVKPEYAIDVTKKLDVNEFADSVLKSNIDETHGWEWMKEHGVYDYPRKVDEVYIWANGDPGRVPLYFDFMLEAKEHVEAKVAELGIPWETDDYQAMPDWKPGCGYEIEDPDFDILPVYHTDAINTDSWLMDNPYVTEINEENPYGYTIEMNSAVAKQKGLKDGDKIRLSSPQGASVEGIVALSEGVHPECVSVLCGHWGSKSKYMPLAKDKGVPVVHLVPGQDPARMDHVCSAFDQSIRVKVEKIA